MLESALSSFCHSSIRCIIALGGGVCLYYVFHAVSISVSYFKNVYMLACFLFITFMLVLHIYHRCTVHRDIQGKYEGNPRGVLSSDREIYLHHNISLVFLLSSIVYLAFHLILPIHREKFCTSSLLIKRSTVYQFLARSSFGIRCTKL